MAVVNAWVGRTSDTSALVIGKVSGVTSARLAVDTDSSFGSPDFLGPVEPDIHDIVRFDIGQLSPDTEYHYAIEEDSVLDSTFPGQFLTHPVPAGDPASFSFVASGDAGQSTSFPGIGSVLASNRISNSPIFSTIRALDPLFFWHMGDLHYYDLGSHQHGIVGGATLANYRQTYDDILLQPNQHDLYRNVATVLSWDDHDFGPNNSDGTFAGKGTAGEIYRERVPSYSLPDPNGAIYHQWQIGRVQFVQLDVRFYRSPNTTPNGPDKTMLGSIQKAWLTNLLNTSQARFMVVMSPGPWLDDSSGDGWKFFPDERAEIGQLFIDTNWSNRMVMLSADWHAMAFDSGANNPDGGFPNWVIASMDASPGPTSSSYDIGVSAARNQYGLITVTDQGGDISIQADGYQDENVLFSHTVALGDAPPPVPTPEPGIPPAPLPVGIVKPTIVWRSYDFITGELIADLPELRSDSIERMIGAYTQATLHMPIPIQDPGALGDIAFQATTPRRTMIVAVINNEPAWGGRVMRRVGGTSGELEISTSTIEAYFRRRKVRDHNFSQVDEADIMRALAEDAGNREVEGLGLPGGNNREIDAPRVGVLADQEYLASDRISVYDRMRERSARLGGLEWTIELIWSDSTQNHVRKVLRVAPRIGIPSDNPIALFEITPDAVFESTSDNNASYVYDEDESEQKAATWVEAYAPGEGDDQLGSEPAIATDLLTQGYPIEEYHWQPSSSIENVEVLNSHAANEIILRKNGAKLWNVNARWNFIPQLNIDWRLGDDIAWKLIGHRHPPKFDEAGNIIGGGVVGQGRCIGWKLNPTRGTIEPIMLDPQSGG